MPDAEDLILEKLDRQEAMLTALALERGVIELQPEQLLAERAAPVESASVAALAGELRSGFTEAVSIAQEAVETIDWYEGALRTERRRRLRVQRELQQEREQGFPFTDADVLVALRQVYVGEPVSATAVARALHARTHSASVRTGRALSRLERTGSVNAIPPTSHRQTRWLPA